MKSIFAVQRVSQKFKAVVDTSPSIQTKVFRRLQNTPAETWIACDITAHGVRKFDVHATPTEDPMPAMGKPLRPVVLNPLLKVVPRPSCFPRPWTLRSPYSDDEMLWSGRKFVEIDVRQGLLGNDPSFLKTHITDPPTRKARIAIAAEYQLEPDSEPETGIAVGSIVESEDGLTFGDLIHARVDAKLSWKDGTGDFEGVDIDLQEMMATAACPIVTKKDSYPTCTLFLFGVCFPTEKQRADVAASHQNFLDAMEYQESVRRSRHLPRPFYYNRRLLAHFWISLLRTGLIIATWRANLLETCVFVILNFTRKLEASYWISGTWSWICTNSSARKWCSEMASCFGRRIVASCW
jgi:hypothetical protein